MNMARGKSTHVAVLVVRRRIPATAEQLFAAWTDPAQLIKWWGPQGIECSEVTVDLRPGGEYAIANRFPDASVLWIRGRFELIERPHRLVFSWRVGTNADTERVTVQFTAVADATEVIFTHERIADEQMRERHAQGWAGCLDGLTRYVSFLN
jgi:uncharacterized protein YndB with AHSA1/START domain